MGLEAIFGMFGAEDNGELFIDRDYVPGSTTFPELVEFSKLVGKRLNLVKRNAYVVVSEPTGTYCLKYCDLDEDARRRIETALDRVEVKRASHILG